MPDPVLHVSDVSIRHDERETFTPGGASFTVMPGEVVLLLGPSGCGKSSLALATNGLIPHVISAEIFGDVVSDGLAAATTPVAQLSEHVAMVFQDPDAQVVTGSVFDEACFALENMLLPVDEVLSRAEDALRVVGLWQRREDSPDVLSGGERQRLAIACAVAMRTPLLVLDEPTANLDPSGSDEVYAVLRRLVADGERAIVLIEHDLDAALSIVDRVVVLDRDGRTAFDGATREVLTGNADEITALGVWLPVATAAALRLRRAGLHIDPLPLTPDELAQRLETLPLPPLAAQHPAPLLGDPVISVRELTIKRTGRTLIDNVSLEVRKGEFLAIVGANGAGKTTLIQAMAGVSSPPKHRVSVAGLDAATGNVRALAKSVGFVFQNPEHQFVTNTVHDELAHGLRVHGGASGARLDDEQIAERVDEVLRRFGLAELRDVHPFLLSGGQKRRLSVGTALIVGAPILALDEPTFGQDRERADELMSLLAALHSRGSTVIMVTHDMQLVAEYATRVIVMNEGAIAASGTVNDVFSDDAALHAARLHIPPLARAMLTLSDPQWRSVRRLAELPGGGE